MVLVVYMDMDVLAIMALAMGLVKPVLLVMVEVEECNKHVNKVSKKQVMLEKMRK